jgi:hypothetical protein
MRVQVVMGDHCSCDVIRGGSSGSYAPGLQQYTLFRPNKPKPLRMLRHM